jgi:hypothetical protein
MGRTIGMAAARMRAMLQDDTARREEQAEKGGCFQKPQLRILRSRNEFVGEGGEIDA